jgi:hypothetical protein
MGLSVKDATKDMVDTPEGKEGRLGKWPGLRCQER